MSVSIQNLGYRYEGAGWALRALDLDIDDGETVAVLGPSGSGKTTLLQLLAGLLVPAEGEIRVGGAVLSRGGYALAPEKRNVGLVFQDFALWPHMTVAQTIAFPLRMHRFAPAARDRRVAALVALVRLTGLESRYPHELSGGQRQRVAIARALAAHPALVLLDEPMSNLDAQLRERMRVDIAHALRHEGVTAVYVTHDRAEALAVADRIAVIEGGRLMQVARPEALYRRPGSAFAATFVGSAALVPARVVAAEPAQGVVRLTTAVEVEVGAYAPTDACRVGRSGHWLVRPEHLTVSEPGTSPAGRAAWLARVERSAYAGSHWQLELRSPHVPEVTFVAHHDRAVAPGSAVLLSADPAQSWFVPEPVEAQEHAQTGANTAVTSSRGRATTP
jgi:iron(III) transport system ATP-binding protein